MNQFIQKEILEIFHRYRKQEIKQTNHIKI